MGTRHERPTTSTKHPHNSHKTSAKHQWRIPTAGTSTGHAMTGGTGGQALASCLPSWDRSKASSYFATWWDLHRKKESASRSAPQSDADQVCLDLCAAARKGSLQQLQSFVTAACGCRDTAKLFERISGFVTMDSRMEWGCPASFAALAWSSMAQRLRGLHTHTHTHTETERDIDRTMSASVHSAWALGASVGHLLSLGTDHWIPRNGTLGHAVMPCMSETGVECPACPWAQRRSGLRMGFSEKSYYAKLTLRGGRANFSGAQKSQK